MPRPNTGATEVRRITLPLILWALLVINLPVIAIVIVASVVEPRGSLWLVLFLVVPAIVASTVTGLVSALGANLGRRATNGNLAVPVGAGVGATVAGTLPLGYLLSIVDGGPGVLSYVICAVLLFVLFAGFAAVWIRRGSKPARTAA